MVVFIPVKKKLGFLYGLIKDWGIYIYAQPK
jgi:hypothetical protein